nr:hypothetical protein [Streptomyces sp. DSM 41633]
MGLGRVREREDGAELGAQPPGFGECGDPAHARRIGFHGHEGGAQPEWPCGVRRLRLGR